LATELFSGPVHLSFGFLEAPNCFRETVLPTPFINAIGTAVPAHDVHGAFIDWAETRIADPRSRALFRRMAERSGIECRWSVLPPTAEGGSPVAADGFYHPGLPGTAERMRVYAEAAPELALAAIADLQAKTRVEGITHLIVASCTGFVAPGIDQIIAARLGLPGHIERTLVGFMGCYAAVSALRLAYHIVRSEPAARVLVVTVELSSLHLQDDDEIEPLLAMLQFGDGAAAALVTAERAGFGISDPFAVTLAESAGLIRWTIGDQGFAMHLSGEVPNRISEALRDEAIRGPMLAGRSLREIDSWAVHAGGRSVLDAVEHGLNLPPSALAESRAVLARYGNMSSSTLPFVLAAMLEEPERRRGIALAFGPGLAAEGFHFMRGA
jgi:predicted naringenin-chalcone synthase